MKAIIQSSSSALVFFLSAAVPAAYGASIGTGPSSGSNSLVNPLKADSIEGLFLAIIDIILVFAVPIIVLFIMYAGFLYVTARGNPDSIKTANSALLWAVVGGVIILGARVILEIIKGTVSAL